jgi:DNA-binding NtrC family response regulator
VPTVHGLLLSRSKSLIKTAVELAQRVEHLRLSVCSESEQACAQVSQRQDVELILTHLPAGGAEGDVVRLLRAVACARRACATVVLADAFSEDQLTRFLRAGAAHYLGLPLDPADFQALLNDLAQRIQFRARGPEACAEPVEVPADGASAGLEGLLEQVRRVARQDMTLLFTGETGTGKTRLARLVHDLSPRRRGPFVVADCGALSPTLLESELFGHVRGAFTGADSDQPGKLATAGEGTLLLDEVNSLPLALQSKLLRATDERLYEPVGSDRALPVRARLLAATNAPLDRQVAAGLFRPDLYYRLNVVAFYLPSLRERRAAIVPLAEKLFRELAGRCRPEVTGIQPEALQALAGYDWPGNIRELRNVIERAIALCQGPEVCREDLPEAIRRLGRSRPAAD